MRKITHLEIALISYLLTFGFSNSLSARVYYGPTIAINTSSAVVPNHCPSEGAIAIITNNVVTSYPEFNNRVDFYANSTANNFISIAIDIAETVINISCSNEADGSIELSVSGGTGVYSYSWSGPSGYNSTDKDINNLVEGDYTVTVTDAIIFTESETFTIIKPSALYGIATPTQVTCNGANDGIITITGATGGYGTYSYSKNNGSTWQPSNTFPNLAPGTYQVLMRDDANINCTKVLNSSLIITQPSVLNATSTPTQITCNGINDGMITISGATGGSGTYVYSKDNGSTWQSSNTFPNLAPSTYQVLMRDDANINCTKVLNSSLIITQPSELSASVASTDISCFGAIDGSITISSPTGGYGSYEYSINNGSSWQISGLFENLAPATYQVLMRDAANVNCTKVLDSNLSLTQPSILNASYALTPITCFEANDGKIVISSPSGGYGTYQYSINNGSSWENSGVYNNLGDGTYHLLVRDKTNTNCVKEIDSGLVINQPTVLGADVLPTHISCNNTSDGVITFSNPTGGSGSYQYSIDNGSTWQASGTFSSLPPTTYSTLIRDANALNCEIHLGTIVITQRFELNADVDFSNVSCNGANDGSITVTNATGGYGNYEYSINGSTWKNIGVFENLSTNNYSVQVRDLDNPACLKILNFALTISQPVALTSTLSSKTDVQCTGEATGSATVEANGGTAPYTYTWGALGSGATKSNLTAGSYIMTAIDANGCEAAPLSVTILEPTAFLEIKEIVTTAGCYGQNNATATIEVEGGTGAYTYLWNGIQTGITATGLGHGSHTIEVTDANGCIREQTFSISAPNELQITGFDATETTYYGSATATATVNISGGTPNYTFLWSNGQTEQTAKNLVKGTYTVTVTDIYGCTTNDSIEIKDAIDADILASSICDFKKDEIRESNFEAINVRGGEGTGTYAYSWNFGSGATPATATGAGDHDVTYLTAGEKTITLTITSGNQSFEMTYIQYVFTCYSTCSSQDLKIDEFYIGDQLGNKINFSDCETNPNPVGASVWIDFGGNASRYAHYMEFIVYVNHPDGTHTAYENSYCNPDIINPIPDKVKITDIDFHCSDVISLENFYISVNQNTGEGCNSGSAPKCFTIGETEYVSAPFYASAIATELLCNGGNDGTITATGTGGTKPYDYNINGGTYSEIDTFGQLPAGNHIVNVKDADNKVFSVSIDVIEPTNPLTISEISMTPTTCFGGNDGSATIEASGGTPRTSGQPYIYVWDNGQTSATATNLSAGNYVVKAIDANGCEIPLSVTVTEPAKILADAGPDQTLLCGNNSTFLEAVYSGVSPDLGTWTVINGPDPGIVEDPSSPTSLFTGTIGTYTLRWTVPCGENDDVKINISNCSTIDFDGVDDHIDFGNNFNPTGNFALEAWVKQDVAAGTGVKTIISKRDINDAVNGYELGLDNNTPFFKWNIFSITSSHPIGTDRWYHIAVVQDNFTKLYVDGILVATGAITVPISNSHKFIVGGVYNSTTPYLPSNYFHGWIEEVRIWSTALTEEQLHFMMNQRIVNNAGKVRGVELPLDVPDGLTWDSLDAYYQLERISNGFTLGEASSGIEGKLMNITTSQERTAPLPYISNKSSSWFTDSTWLRPNVWDPPSSTGINGDTITWNIARISHNINSGGKDISLLGLLSQSNKLTMANPNENLNENNSGQALTISHYLDLDGNIDLVGESQLIQTEGSILDDSSSGYIERDQQGTASSYNYNYWSSPVVLQGAPQNSAYTISEIMKDGTNAAAPINLNFGNGVTYADGGFSNPRKVSNYWLYKFHGEDDEYSEWEHIGSSGTLNAGEGYTMKGTSGNATITTPQNYAFKGKPNNGDIALNVIVEQNYLVGNPYPSAIDAIQFILDNIQASGGNNSSNVFNGALYFWDHFGGKTHTLREYVGGYAIYNLLGGSPAIATDDRINSTGDIGGKEPGQFIPVGQGFFINTASIDSTVTISGGDILFKNRQRSFMRETTGLSVFHAQEKNTKSTTKEAEANEKIRISFKSPLGYNRQLLVGANSNASNGFDLGYDAPMNEYNKEDMFWIIGSNEFVIQGVGNFDLNQILPLGIIVDKEGAIHIQIDKLENIPDDKNIYLNDKLNGVIHDLRISSYTSTSEVGYILDRFEIIFHKDEENNESESSVNSGSENQNTSIGTGSTNSNVAGSEQNNITSVQPIIDPVIDTEDMTLRYAHISKEIQIINPNQFPIKDLRVYKVNGELLKSFGEVENSKEARISIKNYSTGVYTVRCFYLNNVISKKIIIKN